MAKILPITPTLLSEFDTCPRKYVGKYITKEVGFVSTPALEYGRSIHEAIEKALKAKDASNVNPRFVMPYIQWVLDKASSGMELHIEESIAITRQFSSAGWWDKDVWLRCKTDFLLVDHVNKINYIGDWKTGKPREDKTQASISALCASALTGYKDNICMWVHIAPAYDTAIVDKINVSTLASVEPTLQLVRRYEAACKSDEFPAKPSGLCKAHCEVFSCEFNQRSKPDKPEVIAIQTV